MITIEEFRDYCSDRASSTYDYLDVTNCAIAQFLKTKTSTSVWVDDESYMVGMSVYPIPKDIRDVLHRVVNIGGDNSFIALCEALTEKIGDDFKTSAQLDSLTESLSAEADAA